jgi:glycosyltransferase involved in cell wall biosynthesis
MVEGGHAITRILFIAPGVQYSSKHPFEQRGSESQILGVSSELADLGHEVLVMGRFGQIPNVNSQTSNNVHFINIESPDLKDDCIYEVGSAILYSKLAAKKAKDINPDILSLNERFSAYYPSRLNYPKTFTTHNPDAMVFYRDFAIELNKLNYLFFEIKRRIEEGVMTRSEMIVALTASTREYLNMRGFTKSTIIPNAVDPRDYGSRGDSNCILYAGRLSKVKGLTYLIQAYSGIDKRYDANLVIAGSGEEELVLRSIVDREGIKHRVTFLPFLGRAELRRLLSTCSVFALPSLFESLPVTMLEAMASEKAVVASNIAGPKDVITDGYDGILFEKGNVGRLRDCLEVLLSDDAMRKSLGRNARRTIEERHSFEKVSKQYLRVFRSIQGGGTS